MKSTIILLFIACQLALPLQGAIYGQKKLNYNATVHPSANNISTAENILNIYLPRLIDTLNKNDKPIRNKLYTKEQLNNILRDIMDDTIALETSQANDSNCSYYLIDDSRSGRDTISLFENAYRDLAGFDLAKLLFYERLLQEFKSESGDDRDRKSKNLARDLADIMNRLYNADSSDNPRWVYLELEQEGHLISDRLFDSTINRDLITIINDEDIRVNASAFELNLITPGLNFSLPFNKNSRRINLQGGAGVHFRNTIADGIKAYPNYDMNIKASMAWQLIKPSYKFGSCQKMNLYHSLYSPPQITDIQRDSVMLDAPWNGKYFFFMTAKVEGRFQHLNIFDSLNNTSIPKTTTEGNFFGTVNFHFYHFISEKYKGSGLNLYIRAGLDINYNNTAALQLAESYQLQLAQNPTTANTAFKEVVAYEKADVTEKFWVFIPHVDIYSMTRNRHFGVHLSGEYLFIHEASLFPDDAYRIGLGILGSIKQSNNPINFELLLSATNYTTASVGDLMKSLTPSLKMELPFNVLTR